MLPNPADSHDRTDHHFCSGHQSFWDYCNSWLKQPFADDRPPLYQTLPPGTTLETAIGLTRFLVFLGAIDSPEIRQALNAPDTVVLVFDPDPETSLALLPAPGHKPTGVAPHLFTGNPDEYEPPLADRLPDTVENAGFPAFFVTRHITDIHPDYANRVINHLEVLYYRNRLYPLEIPERKHSYPHRDIVSACSFDQYKHHCENLSPKARYGSIAQIKGAFQGKTAVLIAAGPALDGQLDWLRTLGDHVLLVAVNNALRVLLKAGIEPHFAVISDNSAEAGLAFSGLPLLSRCNLVAHALSHIGDAIFPWVYFFDNDWTPLFARRPDLPHHGSVITTAFSLAEHLGCHRAVLVGAQLSSDNPRRLDYSKGTIHERGAFQITDTAKSSINMYPATAMDGSRVFTTPNFHDASLWFLDRIRMSGMHVVNTVPKSIVHGEGIEYAPQPELPADREINRLFDGLPRCAVPQKSNVLAYARDLCALWQTREKEARDILRHLDSGENSAFDEAVRFVQACDEDNRTTMLHRFRDFANYEFHVLYFKSDDPRDHIHGVRYFLEYALDMARFLKQLLHDQIQSLENTP